MIVETHNNFANPQRFEASRVVIRDCFDQPLVIALQVDDRTYQIYTQDDPEFPRVLRNLGIESTIVVDTVDPQALHALPGKIWTP